MTAPISGPFTRTQYFYEGTNTPGMPPGYAPSQTIRRQWYRQKKPFDRPLPYELDLHRVVLVEEPYPPNAFSADNAPWYDGQLETTVGNKLYGKFVDACGDTSQWLNNMLEARKSLQLLTGPLLRITTAARKLRKGDIRGASKALGVDPRDTRLQGVKRQLKNFGDSWLQIHFGWAPLLDDIHNALKTLTETDFGSRAITVKASDRSSWAWKTRGDYGSFNSSSGNTIMRGRMSARVRISNPNLFLLQQLGFVNPASVAWEAVPYSFVVDWFANVGQVLSAYTDLVGLTIIDPYNTFTQATFEAQVSGNDGSTGYPPATRRVSYESFYMRRRLGLINPTLQLKPFKGFSVQRGATAVALVLQFLRIK